MLEELIRRFLYYPTKIQTEAPIPYYVEGAVEVWMESSNGNRIHGLYWKAPKGRPTILFLHGNAQSVYDWALVEPELASMECGLLLIDYPGYGKSTGEPSEQGLYSAGNAAMDFLIGQKDLPAAELILFGKSLGGGVASELAIHHRVLAVILESTFRSIPSVAKRLLPMLPEDSMFDSEIYDTLSRMSDIHSPVLVVHGTEDELIPSNEGKALFEAANEPKQIYLVEGAGHNDVSMVAGDQYGWTLREWLDDIQKGQNI